MEPAKDGSTVSENDGDVPLNHHRTRLPVTVVLATLLHCVEFVIAAFVCNLYNRRDQALWMGLTVVFMVVPTAITQLVLVFFHGDVRRNTPVILLAHLLLGPVIRCVETLIIYVKARGRAAEEEPYVTLVKKISLKKGQVGRETEWAMGQSGRMLTTHSRAFKLTAVIQAFLGSMPQLTLQAYASVREERHDALEDGVRLALMAVALVSATYGALACSLLDVQLRYGDYEVRFGLVAYLCMVLWRGLEVATRVASLVLFAAVLAHWVALVLLANLLLFFLLPWAVFWARRGSLPCESSVSRLSGAAALCLLTLLYACVNVVCWSAVQLDLSHDEFVEKKENWRLLAVYYYGRLAENVLLNALWYLYRSESGPSYYLTHAPALQLLAAQLVCYVLAVLFMLLFYQFCHPCRRVLDHNICVQVLFDCCPADRAWDDTSTSSESSSGTAEEDNPNPSDPQNAQHTDISQVDISQQGTAIVDDT